MATTNDKQQLIGRALLAAVAEIERQGVTVGNVTISLMALVDGEGEGSASTALGNGADKVIEYGSSRKGDGDDAKSGGAAGEGFFIGRRVLKDFGPIHGTHHGTVAEQSPEGYYMVQYDDGDSEEMDAQGINDILVQGGAGSGGRGAAKSAGAASKDDDVFIGRRVSKEFRGYGTHAGTVVRKSREGAYFVRYDDGDAEELDAQGLAEVLANNNNSNKTGGKKRSRKRQRTTTTTATGLRRGEFATEEAAGAVPPRGPNKCSHRDLFDGAVSWRGVVACPRNRPGVQYIRLGMPDAVKEKLVDCASRGDFFKTEPEAKAAVNRFVLKYQMNVPYQWTNEEGVVVWKPAHALWPDV